jgi:hypothetical protein
MTHSQGIGSDEPEDRADRDGDGAPDKSEREFAEAGQVQPQPASAPNPKTQPAAQPETTRRSG